MTAKQFRQAMWSLAAAVMVIITARRWRTIRHRAASSDPHNERLIVPLPVSVPTTVDSDEIETLTDEDDQEDEQFELPTRKVSKDRRISFRGQQYGPLPEHLIGQQVYVTEEDQELQISVEDEVIATLKIGHE